MCPATRVPHFTTFLGVSSMVDIEFKFGSFCNITFCLFTAKKHPEIVTIGIGDGGNEIGMGKVFERVVANVQFGSEIACSVASHYLITAGVSNWGGYALAKAIFMCASCPVHDRYRRKGLGHSGQFAMSDFVSTTEQVRLTAV